MSDPTGVLYTDHRHLRGAAPVVSLWSYASCARTHQRHPVVINANGSREFWLDRSDPLLNTILPGTAVSLIVNRGDAWAAGRSLARSALLPRICVVGPFTQPRLLHVGRSVDAVGVVIPVVMTYGLFGVPATELVDQIVDLQDLWGQDPVERIGAAMAGLSPQACVALLRDEVVSRLGRIDSDAIALGATRAIQRGAGTVSVDRLARHHGMSRQLFARRFAAAAGVRPKLFARITRFQSLVHMLLTTDVSQWAAQASAAGFYDQPHMINEFREFAGSSPTVFFQPHGGETARAGIELRGRPSEWARHFAPRGARIGRPGDGEPSSTRCP
jgi:AraC-like DNA-binding protein